MGRNKVNKFKLALEFFHYNKGDILVAENGARLLILSAPKLKYKKWYYRLLNKLTFNLFFNYELSYTVELLEDEGNGTLQ